MKKSPSDSLLRAHSRGSFSRLVFESEPNNGGGHVNRPLLFRLFQVVVLFLRLITPCSYLFLIALPIFQWQPSQFGGFIPFTLLIAWCCLEALFFPYYCYLFQRLNSQDSNLQHFAINKKTRMRLVKNCFEALRLAGPNPEVHVRTALKGWFLDVPLDKVKRGNLESWCAWAFFGEDIKNLKPDEIKDNIEIVNYIEKQADWTFPEGYQDDLPSVRLDLDPIFATQRPLVFYATIFGMNVGAHIGLFLLGFRRRYDCSNDAQVIYYRKGNGRKNNKGSNNSTSSKNNNAGPNNINNSNNMNKDDQPPVHPLVFVHGIGIGFAHYLGFVAMIPPEIDVYLLEWPHVAMQMASSAPQIEESVNAVLKALDTDGHEKACLSAHSLGNAFISWMLHHPIACRRVCSTLLIDPVTFLLCDPTVATTVVYNEPETTIDFLMHFFVARELFIANALSRHFSWSHNILFVEDLSAVDSKDVNAYSPNTSINETSNNNNTTDSSSNDTSTTPSLIQLVASVFTGSTTTTPTKTNNNNNNTNKNTSGKRYSLQSANLYALDSVPHLDMRHTIIMSLEDSIVPVPAVLRYLQAKASQGHSCFEVLTFKGIHGEVFLHPTWVKLLSAKVRLQCGLPSLEHAVVDITDTTTTGSNTGDTATQLKPLVERMNSSGHNTRSSTSAVKNNKQKSS